MMKVPTSVLLFHVSAWLHRQVAKVMSFCHLSHEPNFMNLKSDPNFKKKWNQKKATMDDKSVETLGSKIRFSRVLDRFPPLSKNNVEFSIS